MAKALLATIAVAALTILPALVQGRFTNRWGTPTDLTNAGEQMHEFPRRLGAWTCGDDERPLSEAVCRELGLVEHFHRRYTHDETGERLDVLLMVGPPGRLVRHPPDVCYANRANRLVEEAQELSIELPSRSHRFKLLHFQRTAQPMLEDFWVAYAFAAKDGVWASPNSPRLAYGAATGLYKLQVLSEIENEDERQAIRQFLAEFVEVFPTALPKTSDAAGKSGG